MKRKDALTAIKAEVAKHGYPTEKAMLIYIRTRIGRDAYTDVLKEGRRIFEAERLHMIP